MWKWERELGEDDEEVDRIIDGGIFRSFSIHSSSPPARRTVPMVDRIMEGPTHSSPSSSASKLERDKNTEVDLISRMPDVILQFIISFLTMREAAATAVLSTRWRNLWTTSLSCLNFNFSNMDGRNYPRNMFKGRSKDYVTRKFSDFTRWVDRVVQLCLASRLDALRVSFILDKDSASHIDRWIMSAVAQGVTDIQLDFHYENVPGPLYESRTIYEFPAQQVASSLKYLQLKFCAFHLPPDFTGFTSLVNLTLSFVHLNQSLVDNILSKSLLEFLSLQNCYYPAATFKITGPSLLLKHLHIKLLSSAEIEVHDINLLSFELDMCVRKLSIKNAPNLARFVLQHALIKNFINVPQLETLFLNPLEKISIVPQSHVFNNLKRLAFVVNFNETDLSGVVYILKACQLLQRLELDMGITERRNHRHEETMEELAVIPGSPHNTLKEIELYGFQAYPEKIEFSKYLLNNAIVLKKMEIYTTTRRYLWNDEWELFESTAKRVPVSLKEAFKLLQTVARSSTKLELYSSLNL